MLNSTDDEREIIKRLKAGDLNALNILMNRYKDELYRLAFRILGNKEDAEEVLQDTFLKAFQKIKSFEEKSKLSTWLYRICVNQSLNKRKSSKRQLIGQSLDSQANQQLENKVASESLQTEFSKSEIQETIIKAVSKLKPSQSAIVSLYYLQGFSCMEIAEIFRKPVNTIKTELFRARNHLKKILSVHQINEDI